MQNRFDKDAAKKMVGLEHLVYLSNIIGQDELLVQHGGGNSSLKTEIIDFGESTGVLYVKGSGTDMKTISQDGFVALKLSPLRKFAEKLNKKEPMADSEMMQFFEKCLMDPSVLRNPKAPSPSVETPLHCLVDREWIVHTHDYATEALTNTSEGHRIVKEVYGSRLIYIPYARPGIPLAKSVTGLPLGDSVGFVLSNHGLVIWGDTAEEAYLNLLDSVNRAEECIESRKGGRVMFAACAGLPDKMWRARKILPKLRGDLAKRGVDNVLSRVILTYNCDPQVLAYIGSEKLWRLAGTGMATPEHILRAGTKPLVMSQDDDIKRCMDLYETQYREYFATHNKGENMLPPRPKIVLVPGVGMIAAERDKSNSNIAADCYRHAIRVMEGAEAVGEFKFLSPKDIFDFEYWELERKKEKPSTGELAGKVALITGAAGGIGKATADLFAQEGAHVILADINKGALDTTTKELSQKYKQHVLGVVMDVTKVDSIVKAFDEAVMAYGGLDIFVSNAGHLDAGKMETAFGLTQEEIRKYFQINTEGPMLAAMEAAKIMKEQDIGGSIIFNASKAGYAGGKGLSAYGASKAGLINFARAAAQEYGPYDIRVNYVNADRVDTNLFSQLLHARAKAAGKTAGEQLSAYTNRKVLRGSGLIDPVYVARAFLIFASDRFSGHTTGSVYTVDDGLPEAFPR